MFWMIFNSKFYFTKIILIDLNKEKRDFVMKITRTVEGHRMMRNKNVYVIRLSQLQIGFNAIMSRNVEVQIGIICNVPGFKIKILKIWVKLTLFVNFVKEKKWRMKVGTKLEKGQKISKMTNDMFRLLYKD